MAERALADADQADARRGAAATCAPCWACRSPSRTPRTWPARSRAGARPRSAEPAARDGELVSRLRVGRRRDAREDEPPGAGDHRLHRGPRLRSDAQSLGPGRLGRAARAAAAPRPWPPGSPPAATASDGARLDPHPGRQLRAGGPQAAARPDPALAAHRALVRPERGRLRGAQRGRRRAAPRRGRRHRRPAPLRRRRPSSHAGPPAGGAVHASGRRRRAWTRSCAARSRRPASACGRSATPWTCATPSTRSRPATASWRATSAGSRRTWRGVPRPDRLQRRTRGLRPARQAVPGERGRAREARRRGAGGADQPRSSSDFDVLVTPTTGKPPGGRGGVGGHERRAHAARPRRRLSVHGDLEPHRASRRARCRRPSLSDKGLPLGVQLVGRPDSEETLLSLAAQLEADVGWTARQPPSLAPSSRPP